MTRSLNQFIVDVDGEVLNDIIETKSGVELYLAANSVDFELPEQYFGELVNEVALLIGVNLRDANVYNYSNSEITKQENR